MWRRKKEEGAGRSRKKEEEVPNWRLIQRP
jgi:hypothetical protein